MEEKEKQNSPYAMERGSPEEVKAARDRLMWGSPLATGGQSDVKSEAIAEGHVWVCVDVYGSCYH